MFRKIKDSFPLKIFLLTFVMQVIVCSIVCGALIITAPSSYDVTIQDQIAGKVEELCARLENVPKDGSGQLLDDFILENDVDIVIYGGYDTIYERIILVPSVRTIRTRRQLDKTLKNIPEENNIYTGTASFTFSDKREPYTLYYIFTDRVENAVVKSLVRCLPYIALLIPVLSAICSYIYYHVFGKPIKQMSELSSGLANMDLTRKIDNRRTDEVGRITSDLDTMAGGLRDALEELNIKNGELQKELARVNELEEQKSVFFMAASHELKTPVTAMECQLLGMIEDDESDHENDEYLSKLFRNVKRMQSLIEEIFTVTKMKSGNEIKTDSCDIASVLEESISEASDLFEIRNISVSKDLSEGLSCEANRELLLLAFGTFLSNAVFYCDEGTSVTVRAAGTEDDKILVTVANPGMRISDEDLPHLFEAFYRSDSSRSRRSGGSGLGLYLARLIIEKHGGTCALENTEDGVLASIILPFTENP